MLYGGEPFYKELVFTNDSIYLGLLQHDFRNQNMIGIFGISPRKVPTMFVEKVV